MPRSIRALQIAAALLLAALPATAQQIFLTSSSVIGGGPSYGGNYHTAGNPASLAVDEQTGPINVETEQRNNYWLGPDGVTSSYFVLDLGAAFQIGQIDLFNTHNWASMDRSTKDFHINASNTVSFTDSTFGYNLVSGVTILSGTLPFSSDNPPADNIFTSSNGLTTSGVAYRYISFTFDSYRGAGNSVGEGGGLNEIRVSAVPEPATYTLLAGVAAFALILVRRRSQSDKPNTARA